MSNYDGPNKVARDNGVWQGQSAWTTGMWIAQEQFPWLEALFWENHGPGAEP